MSFPDTSVLFFLFFVRELASLQIGLCLCLVFLELGLADRIDFLAVFELVDTVNDDAFAWTQTTSYDIVGTVVLRKNLNLARFDADARCRCHPCSAKGNL